MERELVVIKVKIGLRPNGHADHPDWPSLPLRDAESHIFGGWKYDKTCGHKEDSVDSPLGMQWGCLTVSEAFAMAAEKMWPNLITRLTEEEYEDFWNNKAHAHLPENNHNLQILQGLQIERDLRDKLGQPLTEIDKKIKKAIDPDDSEPGIKRNDQKFWQGAKAKLGSIKIMDPGMRPQK